MTEITVGRVTDDAAWNDLVDRSRQATPFHRYECLETYAEYSDTTLHAFGGFEDGDPVGLFPVFSRSVPMASLVFSPPPNLKVPYLGPVFADIDGLGGHAREERYWNFVWDCLKRIRTVNDPNYMNFRTPPGLRDARPFEWTGCDSKTKYTFVVDLSPGAEALFDRFGKDVRSNVRDCEDADCRIERGGHDTIRRILEQVRDRHEAQGLAYPIDETFLTALYDRMPNDDIRPYACRLDGEFVGGNIVVAAGDDAYAWVGAGTPDVDLGVNDAIHWYAMRDCLDRGETRYDLMGANNRRLAEYKAKFAPTLEKYKLIRSGALPMKLAERVYRRVRDMRILAR